MDSEGGDGRMCNGSKPPAAVADSKEVGDKEEGEDYAETKSLLPATRKAWRQQSSTKLRVQWNDRNGNKLVEVLEFQPSDSSDSEDDSSCGEWIQESTIFSWIPISCCLGGQRSRS